MTYFILVLYLLVFAFFAWHYFSLAFGFFIISLPAYLIRFSFGPLPTTLLELQFGTLFTIWLIRFAHHDLSPIAYRLFHRHSWFTVSCFLFLLSSLVSIFVSVDRIGALGVWRAFFLEPALVFMMLVGRGQHLPKSLIPWSLALSSIPVSLLAVIQKFTSAHFPPSLEGTYLFGRVTSFFTAANAVGLYLELSFFFIIYLLVVEYRNWKTHRTNERIISISVLIFTLLSSILSIIFTRSAGTWLGLAVGVLILLVSLGYKKLAAASVLLAVLASLFFPPLHSALVSKDRSTGNRFTLWHYTWDYLTASPQHFVFGAGLRSYFERIQKPHYNVRQMEALTYPHNIFLNFWSEIGLIGMLAFAATIYYLFRISYLTFKHSDTLLGAILLATLAAFFIHGLVDVPYFKNDLAMLFWVLASLIMVEQNQNSAL